MKIRNKRIHYFKFVSGINKYIGPPTLWIHPAVLITHRLQYPTACGAHGNYPLSFFLCRIYFPAILFINAVVLTMHFMLLYNFDLHRPEGSQSYMQRNISNVHALILYFLQKLLCKMQPCGRSGSRSFML